MYKISGIGTIQENVYFVSNTMFGDEFYSNLRGYSSVGQMNDDLISSWNSVVSTRDIVYHLGNFSTLDKKNVEHVLKRLNGRLNLIVGESDTNDTVLSQRKYFKSTNYKLNILVDDYNISLNSHPQVYWNRFEDTNSFHFYGHYPEGNKIKDPFSMWNAKSLCVDIDDNKINYRPIEFRDAIDYIKLKLDYFKNIQGLKQNFL